jgi:uncharacterized protein
MKKVFLLGIMLMAFHAGHAQASREFKMKSGDSTLVMKRYVFMLLNEGPNRKHDSLTAAGIQAGHMKHIDEMAKTGKLVVAGPFEDGGKHRGILIFDVDSIAQALRMEATDPAVLSGRLEMQAIYWWTMKGAKLP